MLNSYNPTIEAPGETSPDWYVAFHNSFYLSQITNNLLLSCLEEVSQAICEKEFPSVEDEKQKLLKGSDAAVDLIINSLQGMPETLKVYLYSMQLDPGESLTKHIKIDSDKLLDSSGRSNWHEVIKGFLNLWEFLFLFGIMESTLKSILNFSGNGTNGLINLALNKYKSLGSELNEKYSMNRNYCSKLWSVYLQIRDLYAHSHGVLDQKNIGNIKEHGDAFKGCLATLYNDPSKFDSLLFGLLKINPEHIFNTCRLTEGRFYLLNDTELNVFRNFICAFMPELQRQKN